MQEKSKQDKKAQRRMYYEAHREEILRKYRLKKQKTTQEDRIQIWTEQLEDKLSKETDEIKKIWLESQIRYNKNYLNGKSEKTDICL